MTYLFRFLTLVVISLLGGVIIPFLFHIMIKLNLLNAQSAPDGFATLLIQNAVYVWLGAVLLGLISIFIHQKWRIILLLCPLILPSIFTIFYILTQT